MQGKTCLITGAGSGIGKAAAVAIAQRGATVLMVCRDGRRGEAALDEVRRLSGSDRVELLLADLSSQAAIRGLAATVSAKYQHLDVLLNNAGVYLARRTLTVDGIETTFAVNHLAYFLLTHLLLERLKAAASAGAPSRIVNVSSNAHRRGRIDFDNLQGERRYVGWAAYSNSKLANILFTRELARRLAGTSGGPQVTANCLHPGVVATGIFRNTPRWLDGLIQAFALSPQAGAATSIYLATAPEVAGVSGKYFKRQREAAPAAAALDDTAARRLWQESERLTGLA
jgi:NAD(P)-dependent dehydrogenase (short-subunit alcohol dehydrogenase family)